MLLDQHLAVLVQHHRQLGLLQHHLGDERAVGIDRFPVSGPAAVGKQLPGDGVAAVDVPPGEQLAAQCRRVAGQRRQVHVQGRGLRQGVVSLATGV